jgi:hypothetical protein
MSFHLSISDYLRGRQNLLRDQIMEKCTGLDFTIRGLDLFTGADDPFTDYDAGKD